MPDNRLEASLEILHQCLDPNGVPEASEMLDGLMDAANDPELQEARQLMDDILEKADGADKYEPYHDELEQLRDVLLE